MQEVLNSSWQKTKQNKKQKQTNKKTTTGPRNTEKVNISSDEGKLL